MWLVVGEKIATSRFGEADSKVACACETQVIKAFATVLQAANAFCLLLVEARVVPYIVMMKKYNTISCDVKLR